MPLPKEKGGISFGKLAVMITAVATLFGGGVTIMNCVGTWRDLSRVPAKMSAMEDSLRSVRQSHQDHVTRSESAWEIHTGFPIRRSHPTIEDELNDE